MYENVCLACNKGARSKEQVVQANIEIPSIYVGESSRSIKERGGEHWAAFRSKNQDSHILKHQMMIHPGEEPEFILRISSFYKTALERQVGEAVRIRRRGGQGAVLNSKAEFDRCRIPRLILEEHDQEQAKKYEEEREEQLTTALDMEHKTWERSRIRERAEEHKSMMASREQKQYTKRSKEQKLEGRSRKKRRTYTIIGENWGAGGDNSNLDMKEEQPSPMEQPPTPPIPPSQDTQPPKTPPSNSQIPSPPLPPSPPPLQKLPRELYQLLPRLPGSAA